MKLERRILNIENLQVRSVDDGPSLISGYASVFNRDSVEMYGFVERIAPGAFTRTLKEANDVKALWNHDSNYPLGSTRAGTLKLEEDKTGLAFELDPPNNNWGNDVRESIRRGDTSGVSFGFYIRKQEWDDTDPDNVIRTILDVDLIEISPTPFPAYPDTSVEAREVRAAYESYKATRQAAGAADEIEGTSQEIQAELEAIATELELAEAENE